MQKPPILGFFLLLGSMAHAQQAAVSAGGDATGIGGTVAYSIGQVACLYLADASGSVAQGVQQPFEIVSVGISAANIPVSVGVFPNPTADDITLELQVEIEGAWTFQLFDSFGKLLEGGDIASGKTHIGMQGLPAATYYLNILHEGLPVKSLKVTKNY
jgi:hypothetical protein